MFHFPCKQSQEAVCQKKPPKIQTLQCCVQVRELVLVYIYPEYPLFPNSCLQLSQSQYMAVEEFCHHSQIKNYKENCTSTSVVVVPCQGLVFLVRKISGSLTLDSCYKCRGCPRVWMHQPWSALAQGFLCSAGMS